jgi:hypothetical protein
MLQQDGRPIAPDHPALLALPSFVEWKENPEQQDGRQQQYEEIFNYGPDRVLDRRYNSAFSVEEGWRQIYDQRVDVSTDFQIIAMIIPVSAEYFVMESLIMQEELAIVVRC